VSEAVRSAAIRLYDRFTHGRMGRRAFMTELARVAGGAAAAQALLLAIAPDPAAAAVVPPEDPRLKTRTIEWEPRPGRTLTGYNAAPADSGEGLPVVIVIHENRGLNDHIRDVARRLALAGYSALAPDFLAPAGGTPDDPDRAREMIGALDMTETVADGAATVRWLASPESGLRRVGMVGFCWGGAMVNRLAVASGAALRAGVSFYGPAPDPAEAARVKAALLVILAGEDERVNRTGLPWIEALKAAGRGDGIVYSGVEHAFHNDTSEARYDPAAAEAAWGATLAHFERHLR
jgi:carboxymethylenebutenolidase